MKRAFCVFLLYMMVVGLFVTPTGYNITEEMIDHFGETLPDEMHYPDLEFPTVNYFPSTEGTPHADSILQFYETTDDDVLFFPDAFYNDTAEVATEGALDEGAQLWTWAATQAVGGDLWFIEPAPSLFAGHLNFTVPDGCEGFTVSTYGFTGEGLDIEPDAHDLRLWNYDTTAWVDVGDVWWDYSDQSVHWTNYTTYDPDYWSGNELRVQWYGDDAAGSDSPKFWWDYAEVTFYIMTLADSDHYAEGFNDVSEWVSYGLEAGDGDTFTSDGDLVAIEANNNGNQNEYDGGTDSSMSLSAGIYLEIYYRLNHTGIDKLYVFLWESDGATGDKQVVDLPKTTSWNTRKILTTGVIESITFTVKTDPGHNPVKAEGDYLRVGPATESGFQHDGSTTEGTSGTYAYGTISWSSDGDLGTLNITQTGASGGNYPSGQIVFDTTATACDLERDYYPFFEFRYRITGTVDIGLVYLAPYMDTYTQSFALDSDGAWHTLRGNLLAMSTGSQTLKLFKIWSHFNAIGDSFEIDYDWVKAYSIANYTVTQSASATTTDYAYVDSSGRLVVEKSSAEWLKFEHDPALSVAVGTYPVWNCTLAGTPATADYISYYVGGGWESYYWSDTRGSYTETGTLTDLQFVIRHDETLSAIKFWEDATAPTMSDKWVNPPEPYDDESVTITVAATDNVDVYTVKLNAETYPTGFSDVDYTMTESVNNALYKYTFSGMTAGYYEFAINVNDGANTYTEYIPLTVRESEISVNSISLFGAGDDFDYMHWSFKINKDCSYVIREWSENVGASDTYSGNVAEGVRNIAWEKLPTDDTKVNFTVTFTNASLTYVFDSSYEVAQIALSITGDESLSQDEVLFSGTSTKACSWTLYLDSVQEDTGSIAAAGSFVVNWTRTQSVTPSSISFAIKFYTATETVWENGTYDEYSLTAFSIQTLFMDLTDPTISAIFTTSWGNATGYLYENDVQKDTSAEGIPLSYTKATVAGTYNVALKMDAGGEIAWYNTTYSVSAEDALSITALSYDSSGPNISIFVNTNWANCTLTVYENDVQKASGSEGTLSYLKATAAGDYNVSVKVDGTADTLWANYTYTVAAEAALLINTLILDKSGPNITAFVATNWGNCTITIYQADVQKDSDSESITLSYARSTAAGTYTIAIKIDGGASTLWHNDSYTIAITELRVEEERIETSDTYAYCRGYLTLNADYKVYEETIEIATGSVNAGSIEIRWTKASNSVENVTILFTSGGQEYPVYGSYQVASQVTFVVESWWMDLNLGTESYVEFYVLSSFGNATVYVYDNNTLMTTVTESAGGAYSYFWMAESQGLHTITLNITHGATTHTRTRTYYIPDWAVTGLVLRWDLWTFQDNYTMMELESNWMNCTFYVYLNSSLVATSANDPVILNFTRAINIGEYNLTIYADGGTQTYTVKNIRYIITEEGVSYDYSSVTGGRSVRYGDNYYYTVTTEEPAPGVFIDQGTATIISVGGFLIIFTAYLAARELRKREILKTERIFGK